MPTIVSVGAAFPPYEIDQDQVTAFSRKIFSSSFKDIERLLGVFQNSQIEKRHFVKELSWFETEKSFEEKNDAYVKAAVELGSQAITNCLQNINRSKKVIDYEDIDAIFLISSTGFATPSIESRIMNILPFSVYTKRIPIWGLGCAGGASGLSRAYEYCRAYPDAKVLVVSIEFCSLTFQRNDYSKSNLIGTSLFGDGVACALVIGERVEQSLFHSEIRFPTIIDTQSITWKDSLDVMGWDVKNEGLFVVFSKDIPAIIERDLRPVVMKFLSDNKLEIDELSHFVAHPGGKKVLDAYEHSLQIKPELLACSRSVLRNFGNMSSATIFYVLKETLKRGKQGEFGLAAALGPGFSAELLLLRWE